MGHYGRQREQTDRHGISGPFPGLLRPILLYRPLRLTKGYQGLLARSVGDAARSPALEQRSPRPSPCCLSTTVLGYAPITPGSGPFMTDDTDARAAFAAHLRTSALKGGDPLTLPLVMASTYNLPGDPKGLRTYGRSHNATWEAMEALLGHLEGARALAFPSGMAAISAAMLALAEGGRPRPHSVRWLLHDPPLRRRIPEEVRHRGRPATDRELSRRRLRRLQAGFRRNPVQSASRPLRSIRCGADGEGCRRHHGRRQHGDDALRPAAARLRHRCRRRRRHKSPERPFRRAVRPCRQPRRKDHDGRPKLA